MLRVFKNAILTKKKELRKSLAQERKETLLTGGGPTPKIKKDEADQVLESILNKKTLVGLENPFYDDAHLTVIALNKEEDVVEFILNDDGYLKPTLSLEVKVSVYYESLCPDSKKFFTQQLYPSLQGNLSSYVNLTLVPYGKSTSTFDITDWHFQCHHGEIECYGNKIQACALKLIDKGEDTQDLGFNKVSVGFINCLMDKADKTATVVFPTRECALVNPVSNLQDIENCANHTDAANYLSIMGKLTDAVQKPLKSVPTIVFNDEFKQADNDLAQTNFVKALCQYIQGDVPAECSKAGTITFSVALIFISVLFNFY